MNISAPDVCPTCKRPFNTPSTPKRICSVCSKQIKRHDKWCIGEDQKIRHRNCKDTQSYMPEKK